MSSSDAGSSTSAPASSGTGTSGSMMVDQERSFPQQMMLHVYNTGGIVQARQLPFWIDFWENYPMPEDIPPARELRAMFFDDVLLDEENYEDLPYAVVQYLNPRFNVFDPAVLEACDVIEGEDFQLNVPAGLGPLPGEGLTFEQLAEFVQCPAKLITTSRDVLLAPLNVELVSTASRPEEDDLGQRFAEVLSELVWTEEEKAEKPVLELAECRARVAALSRAGISLLDIMEPNTQSYQIYYGTTDGANSGEQIVPETPQVLMPPPAAGAAVVSGSKSTRKRWYSYDDSGLGASPSKRSRLLSPGTIISERKARLRRIVSTPNNF